MYIYQGTRLRSSPATCANWLLSYMRISETLARVKARRMARATTKFPRGHFCNAGFASLYALRIRLRSPRRPGKFAWRLRLRIGLRPHVERVPHSPRLQQLVPHPGCLFSLVVLPVNEGIGELRVMPTCPPVPLPITPRS